MKLYKRILIAVITAAIAFALIFGVNFLVKNKVEANEEARTKAAFSAVYPGADSFDDAIYRSDYLARYLDENGYPDDQVVVSNITFARDEVRDVQGVVVNVSSYKKFGGYIRMLVGVQNDGTVNGYQILRISDAKGLDFKVKDSSFADQFNDVRTDKFSLVNFTSNSPSEIICANGAEDASQAVVRAVNAAILANTFIDEYYGGVLN